MPPAPYESQLPDKTSALDSNDKQLPDVMVKVVQDSTESSNSMVLEATIEYLPNTNDNTIELENKDVSTHSNDEAQNSQEVIPAKATLLETNISDDKITDKSDASKLRDCIIKLTDLTAEERNKWLGLSKQPLVQTHRKTQLNQDTA